uniref:hypothetical protein n=1 Tax=Yoonia sp. TaxID=2212373 RepID=UPI0040470735|tara:strand:- start:1910 stop:2116 length:207 start_codon:yes stop_codon:yes gene_type:complete
MSKGNSGDRFSTEVRARAVGLVFENEADYEMRSACFRSILKKIGCSPQTLLEQEQAAIWEFQGLARPV